MSTREAASAVNRFGLGAMPGDLQRARDPRGWLLAQLDAPPDLQVFATLPDSLSLLRQEAGYRQSRKAMRDMADDKSQPGGRRALYQVAAADIDVRYRVAASTTQPFVERLLHFWSNHFAVSVDKGAARLYAAPMEREAIRPHVLGNFSALLLAVETHPAMLRYLDNVASVGSGSSLAQRQQRRAERMGDDGKPPRKAGLNENLAREILELHTLGVQGGYAQDDVTQLARALTGWGVPTRRELDAARSAFAFHAAAHEPGARRVLGRHYAQDGQAQGEAILHDLAKHPATALHISRKLARHMVSDAPPEALVQRMAKAFTASGGELRALYFALVDDAQSWSVDAGKFKTPDDFVVSAMRAGSFSPDARTAALPNLLRGLGQPVFTPRSPAGFPDTQADWAAGDALRKRLQVAGGFAAKVTSDRTPLDLARAVLGSETVTGPFADALARAGSPRDGFALLFASPAFQWRT